MEVPLTPLEFARRTRALYPDREALVDGELRLTYAQFFERCDRWSAALQRLGVKAGRPRRLHRAEHARAARVVLRRAADRRGARADQLPAQPGRVRLHHQPLGRDASCARTRTTSSAVDAHPAAAAGRPPLRRARRAAATGWLDYEALRRARRRRDVRDSRTIAERDLLTINYTSGTTSRPKGVMITHRNAYMNVVGTLLHLPMRMTDRYLWTLPMFHANGWTFVVDRHRRRRRRTSACARSIRRRSSS